MRSKRVYKLPTEDRLQRAALHYLERYASSEANLRLVLCRKIVRACAALERDPAEFDDMLEVVVQRCVSSNLVNDTSYAESKTASLRRKGHSRRKIAANLMAKGVNQETIDTALTTNDVDDSDAARTYARRRRLGPFRADRADREKDPKRRDKDIAALCRAGFSFAIALRVIDADDEDNGV